MINGEKIYKDVNKMSKELAGMYDAFIDASPNKADAQDMVDDIKKMVKTGDTSGIRGKLDTYLHKIGAKGMDGHIKKRESELKDLSNANKNNDNK